MMCPLQKNHKGSTPNQQKNFQNNYVTIRFNKTALLTKKQINLPQNEMESNK